jgi:hypothetical protein
VSLSRKKQRATSWLERKPSLLKKSSALSSRLLLVLFALHLFSFNLLAFDEPIEPQLTTSRPSDLWLFLPIGYLFTIAIETPVLLLGLSRRLSFRQRLFAGVWLTACTYPVVVLVLPVLFASSSRSLYLLVAETFAPVAECALFWLVFHSKLDSSLKSALRNFPVIVMANLLSFIFGEVMNSTRWFGLF